MKIDNIYFLNEQLLNQIQHINWLRPTVFSSQQLLVKHESHSWLNLLKFTWGRYCGPQCLWGLSVHSGWPQLPTWLLPCGGNGGGRRKVRCCPCWCPLWLPYGDYCPEYLRDYICLKNKLCLCCKWGALHLDVHISLHFSAGAQLVVAEVSPDILTMRFWRESAKVASGEQPGVVLWV